MVAGSGRAAARSGAGAVVRRTASAWAATGSGSARMILPSALPTGSVGSLGVVVTVEHGHDQTEGLGGAEHQRRKAQAAAEPVAAVRSADGLDRDAGLAQDADVAPGGPLRDAELVGEPVRGDARAALDEFEGQQRPRRRARVGLHSIPAIRKRNVRNGT